MNFSDMPRIAEKLREDYPKGTRIVCLRMGDDPRPLPPGSRGTVQSIDDMATIHCEFDNGRCLGLVYGEDSYRKLTEEELAEESKVGLLKKDRPDCPLIGADGNIFNLMGFASSTLKHAGFKDEATEMVNRVTSSGSYEEALGIIQEYVNPVEDDDMWDDEDEDDFMSMC